MSARVRRGRLIDPHIQKQIGRQGRKKGQHVQRHSGAKEHGTFQVQCAWTSEVCARSVRIKARRTGGGQILGVLSATHMYTPTKRVRTTDF